MTDKEKIDYKDLYFEMQDLEEYMYDKAHCYKQALLDIKEYIENTFNIIIPMIEQDILDIVNKALGSVDNE